MIDFIYQVLLFLHLGFYINFLIFIGIDLNNSKKIVSIILYIVKF